MNTSYGFATEFLNPHQLALVMDGCTQEAGALSVMLDISLALLWLHDIPPEDRLRDLDHLAAQLGELETEGLSPPTVKQFDALAETIDLAIAVVTRSELAAAGGKVQ